MSRRLNDHSSKNYLHIWNPTQYPDLIPYKGLKKNYLEIHMEPIKDTR